MSRFRKSRERISRRIAERLIARAIRKNPQAAPQEIEAIVRSDAENTYAGSPFLAVLLTLLGSDWFRELLEELLA